MQRLRGIFPVLQTPLDTQGQIDGDSLAREVDFAIACGAHGIMYPVLGSEFQYLTDAERRRLVELVVRQTAGRVPVVVGVAATMAAAAAEYAEHAAKVGADAVVALPPYLASASREELFAYYAAIAEAAQRPVMIQHSFAGLDSALLSRLLVEIEHVRYVKEEMAPSAHHISGVVRLAGEECWGVFGGALGRWMISEMRRGAVGFMPATEVTDIYVQIWDAFQGGDEDTARAIFNRLLPEINLAGMLGMQVCKEVLVRRGVIATARMRQPGCAKLDEEDHRELDRILENIEPLFRV
ncbi:MAG: dihydrodipicolinate synthase family protein [Anaerolineae bacterium]|nr:dihydrodipicolinate synthase family protein [Anaerolineae bacterium]